MLEAVPWDEGDPTAPQGPDGDWGRGLAVRCVDVDLTDVLEERIEPRSAEHADTNGFHPGVRAQADFSLAPDDERPPFLSPEPELEPSGFFSPEPVLAVSLVVVLFSPEDSSLLEVPPSELAALRRRESVA